MKRHLLAFGVAFLSLTLLFTACKKDEEDTTKNNNNNNNQQQEQTGVDTSAMLLAYNADSTIAFTFAGGGAHGITTMHITDLYYWNDQDTVYYYVDLKQNQDQESWYLPRIRLWLKTYPSGNGGTSWKCDGLQFFQRANLVNEMSDENTLRADWVFAGLGEKADLSLAHPSLQMNITFNLVDYYQYHYQNVEFANCDRAVLHLVSNPIAFAELPATKHAPIPMPTNAKL